MCLSIQLFIDTNAGPTTPEQKEVDFFQDMESAYTPKTDSTTIPQKSGTSGKEPGILFG